MDKIKPILTMDDPWKDLRKDLFGNVEPEVKLEGITMPISYRSQEYVDEKDWMIDGGYWIPSEEFGVEWADIEKLPALAAGTSYGSKEKLKGDPERAIKLNKNLIKMGHHTPLEAIQLNFHISGISKTCGAQVSRHRVGQGHVSASRRFQEQKPAFVYPMLSYIKDENSAITLLTQMEIVYKKTHAIYQLMRGESECVENNSRIQDYLKKNKPIHKEDARFVIPVSTATERSWWINVRALRDFFRLRLAKDAEWEIRRLAQMMFNIVYPLLPSLFEDVGERHTSVKDEYIRCAACNTRIKKSEAVYRHGIYYCNCRLGIYDG